MSGGDQQTANCHGKALYTLWAFAPWRDVCVRISHIVFPQVHPSGYRAFSRILLHILPRPFCIENTQSQAAECLLGIIYLPAMCPITGTTRRTLFGKCTLRTPLDLALLWRPSSLVVTPRSMCQSLPDGKITHPSYRSYVSSHSSSWTMYEDLDMAVGAMHGTCRSNISIPPYKSVFC